MRLLDEISGLAEGDLTRRAVVTAEVTGAIADSFNTMAEQLSGVVKNVKKATLEVTHVSRDANASSTQLAKASEIQAKQVARTIEAINDMAGSIRQVAENAVRSASVSEQSTANARAGAEAVQNTNKAMAEIRKNVQETARSIKRLGESSKEIGNIVQLINDIADRTSILALNASIQAAMAGDAGRGFAVVAEEVQRLAERSTNATKQIDTLIKNIQGEINEAGSSMEESIRRVVEGSTLANDAHNKLQEIETVSNQLAEITQSISTAATQQAKFSQKITMTMEEMGKVSARNLSASQQTTRAINQLTKTTKGLAASVGTFKLEQAKPAQRPADIDPAKLKPLARHAKAAPQGNTEIAA
jgi:twitching motility protein PilJ